MMKEQLGENTKCKTSKRWSQAKIMTKKKCLRAINLNFIV